MDPGQGETIDQLYLQLGVRAATLGANMSKVHEAMVRLATLRPDQKTNLELTGNPITLTDLNRMMAEVGVRS